MKSGTVRVVVNRREIKRMERVHERATAAMGRDIIANARVPDAPPIGRGLVEQGDYVVTRGGNRIDGGAELPRDAEKTDGVDLAVGWPQPALWLEHGTVKMAARPFIGPSADSVVASKDKYLREANRRTT